MKNMRNILESYVVPFLFVCFFIFSLIQGPQFQTDSGSYELGSIIRIGMYPLIIAFFKSIFKTYAFELLVLLQVCLTILSIHLLTNFLKKQFQLSFLSYFFCVTFLLFQAISNSAEYVILSESLAYPLFLLSVLFFLKFVVDKKNVNALAFAVILFLLCFTRQQFVFFYVAAFIYSAYLFMFEKKFKVARNLLFASILSIATFFISERTYHYIFNGHFAGTPFAGTQFLMRPLFIASNSALNSIADSKQRMFMNEVVAELTAQGICKPDEPHKELYLYGHHYNTMYHKISANIWKHIWSQTELIKEFNRNFSDFEALQVIDKNALSMGIVLIKNNFFNFSKYYLKDVIRGMGGYSCFILIMFLMFFSFFAILYFKTHNKNLYIFSIISITMHFGNSSLVCLFEPPMTRYMFYTSTILLIMALILFTNIFKFLKNKNSCAEL